jgi:hypothetical protein
MTQDIGFEFVEAEVLVCEYSNTLMEDLSSPRERLINGFKIKELLSSLQAEFSYTFSRIKVNIFQCDRVNVCENIVEY